jgi:large subunit ribosomal protein L35
MPKLKTHKGAASRFHVTGTGKLLRMKRNRSHLRRKKPARAKRLFSQKVDVSKADVARIKPLLPYGSPK